MNGTWTSNNCNSRLRLVRPNGTEAASNGVCPNGFVEPFTLDATGTWTAELDMFQDITGTGTLKAFLITDQTGAIATNGTGVAVNIDRPGKRALLTFNGTTGQRISAQLTSGTWSANNCNSALRLLRPNGTTAGSAGVCPNGFVEPFTLDATGTWTVELDMFQDITGTGTLKAFLITDQTGPISVGGAAVAVNIDRPGKRALLTFNGTSGQVRSVALTSGTWSSNNCNSGLRLVRPNGTVRTAAGFCPNANLASVTLDATGTWTVEVDPYLDITGTANVALT
jgi:hypothetical protein